MARRPHHEAETVLADANAGMDDDAVADQRIHQRNARTDRAIAADAHPGTDDGIGPDHRAGADLGVRA